MARSNLIAVCPICNNRGGQSGYPCMGCGMCPGGSPEWAPPVAAKRVWHNGNEPECMTCDSQAECAHGGCEKPPCES